MGYVGSVKYFKNYIRASLGSYVMKKKGFYLPYNMKNSVIEGGMRTYRNIKFIKIEHGNIYYFSRRLTIVLFIKMPESLTLLKLMLNKLYNK